ncbi:MAG: HEAT repeat domain-containing protein [Candidatus Hydrogenedentes bacterium]|nr:HEAT repeat domain-containing protein [Candidatus Hydrogenedentota bacterium]
MRRLIASLLLCCFTPLCLAAPLRVTGPSGQSLESLVGSDTLITVVLKAKGAEDPNLKLHSLGDTYFVVITDANKRVTYPYDMVDSIRVQEGAVEKPEFKLDPSRGLTANDQEVVDRAIQRLEGLFTGSDTSQERKVKAATLLALNGNAGAEAYLDSLVNSNDLPTQFDGAIAYYMLNKEFSRKLLREGLESGNRQIRATAALLAGLGGASEFTPELMSMLNDRSAEHVAPAAIALAHLNSREAIPQLISLLSSLNEEKNEASVRALTILGGDDLVEQLEARAKNTSGQELFRIAQVLIALGNETGLKMMKHVFNDQPTITPQAALFLAPAGDYDAEQYLRDQIKRRITEDEPNLVYRAQNAGALIAAGDSSAQAVFQQLLRLSTVDKGRENLAYQNVKSAVFEEFIKLQERGLLTILYPSLEDSDPWVTLDACNAAIALVKPEYRERYLKFPH